MKRLIGLLVLTLMATPLLAQEGGGDGGFGGLFGMGDAPRGTNAPPPDRLVQLRKILLDAKTPLSSDQEKNLSSMLEKDIKQYTTELEKKYPEEVAQARAASAQGGGRGGRGGGGGGRSGMASNSPLAAEMTRINTELEAKVNGALKPEQQAALKTYRAEAVKKAGGFPAFKIMMQDAGTPLTPDQETQIHAFYDEQDQKRRQLMQDSQGQPDPAKLAAINAEIGPKLLKVLNADQKKVLIDSMKKPQP